MQKRSNTNRNISMKTPRPPEILRKSHSHVATKQSTREYRELVEGILEYASPSKSNWDKVVTRPNIEGDGR